MHIAISRQPLKESYKNIYLNIQHNQIIKSTGLAIFLKRQCKGIKGQNRWEKQMVRLRAITSVITLNVNGPKSKKDINMLN